MLREDDAARVMHDLESCIAHPGTSLHVKGSSETRVRENENRPARVPEGIGGGLRDSNLANNTLLFPPGRPEAIDFARCRRVSVNREVRRLPAGSADAGRRVIRISREAVAGCLRAERPHAEPPESR